MLNNLKQVTGLESCQAGLNWAEYSSKGRHRLYLSGVPPRYVVWERSGIYGRKFPFIWLHRSALLGDRRQINEKRMRKDDTG